MCCGVASGQRGAAECEDVNTQCMPVFVQKAGIMLQPQVPVGMDLRIVGNACRSVSVAPENKCARCKRHKILEESPTKHVND